MTSTQAQLIIAFLLSLISLSISGCPHEASPNISYIEPVCTCEGCDLSINFTIIVSNPIDCSIEANHYEIDIYHHNNEVYFKPRPTITGLDIQNNSSTSCNVSLVVHKNTTFIGTNITVLQQEYDNSTVQVYVHPFIPLLCSNNFTLRIQGVLDPVIITDSIVNCSGVYISWERPYSLSCVPILGYIIHILELNYTNTTTSEHYMISSSSDILMDSIQYTISIRSVNGAGTSDDSTAIISWSSCTSNTLTTEISTMTITSSGTIEISIATLTVSPTSTMLVNGTSDLVVIIAVSVSSVGFVLIFIVIIIIILSIGYHSGMRKQDRRRKRERAKINDKSSESSAQYKSSVTETTDTPQSDIVTGSNNKIPSDVFNEQTSTYSESADLLNHQQPNNDTNIDVSVKKQAVVPGVIYESVQVAKECPIAPPSAVDPVIYSDIDHMRQAPPHPHANRPVSTVTVLPSGVSEDTPPAIPAKRRQDKPSSSDDIPLLPGQVNNNNTTTTTDDNTTTSGFTVATYL